MKCEECGEVIDSHDCIVIERRKPTLDIRYYCCSYLCAKKTLTQVYTEGH